MDAGFYSLQKAETAAKAVCRGEHRKYYRSKNTSRGYDQFFDSGYDFRPAQAVAHDRPKL
jgi:hypothetical protein